MKSEGSGLAPLGGLHHRDTEKPPLSERSEDISPPRHKDTKKVTESGRDALTQTLSLLRSDVGEAIPG